jgi:hypothetical protein
VGDQADAGHRRVWSGVVHLSTVEDPKPQSPRHGVPRCRGCKTLHWLGSAVGLVGAIASPPDTGARPRRNTTTPPTWPLEP